MRPATKLGLACTFAALLGACGRAPEQPAIVQKDSAKPTSEVVPSPSEGKKLADPRAEAGSAIGGTASGNTTDPGPASSATSLPPKGGAPEPTGGDGSTRGAAKDNPPGSPTQK